MIAVCLLILRLALTPEEQTLGLMGVSALPENEGMLFIFPVAKTQNFWSFGCLIPLDVGFLDEDLVLQEVYLLPCDPYWKSLPPIHSLTAMRAAKGPFSTVHSTKPCRHVIEMNAGWFERHKIGPGSKLHRDDTGTYFSS